MFKTSQLIIILAALASACAQQVQDEPEESVETQSQALVSEPVQTEKSAVNTPSEAQSAVAPKAKGDAQVSTRLTVRVHRDGRAEVVDAIEVPGYLKLEKNLGRGHLYEVKSGNEVLAVQAIDVDFEQRSLSPDRDISGDVESVEVFDDIPGVGLDKAENAEVELHEVQAAHREKAASIAALGRLQKTKSLKAKFRADGSQLRQAIRAHGRRVHPN